MHEIPEVYATSAETVVIDMSPEHAQVLARVLAHYDVLAANVGTSPAGYESDVWHHTLIKLLGEHAKLQGVDGLISVPVLAQPRHLALVAGDDQ